jgi:regulator of sigma E protease
MGVIQLGALGAIGFYVVSFLVALIVIIFVHEFGHFIVARLCGVKVEAFSIGFGKELLGFNDRHGTRWKICAIPVGGYVRFDGDANAASVPSSDAAAKFSATSMHAQSVPKRMAIVAAGPIANFVLAIAIFTVLFSLYGMPYMRPIVSEIIVGSAAEAAGLLPGDVIKNINGNAITSFGQIQENVFLRPNEKLPFLVMRRGRELSLTITPLAKEIEDNFGGKLLVGQLGVRHQPAADEPLYQTFGPYQALAMATERTWYTVDVTLRFMGKILTGSQSVKQIGGAASIGKGAGDAAAGGVVNFVAFISFLSISVGIVNLFPIPMLDGGHLVFYAIEAVRGKPLGPVAQEWGFRIGFSCVVMLMLLGLFNDAGRLANVFGS